jgi:transcriptional repressor NF-X1
LGPLRSCYCGETDYRARCGDVEAAQGRSCGGVCDAKLACGEHRCERVCHAGAHGECLVYNLRRCYCGATLAPRACGSDRVAPAHQRRDQRPLPVPAASDLAAAAADPALLDIACFSCAAACDDLLPCGCRCQLPCHSGDCPPCPNSPAIVKTCPCGKVELNSAGDKLANGDNTNNKNKNNNNDDDNNNNNGGSVALVRQTVRVQCSDPIPSCGQACGRSRAACDHRCSRPCHTGACAKCVEPVRARCRCGASVIKKACHAVNVALPPPASDDHDASTPTPLDIEPAQSCVLSYS